VIVTLPRSSPIWIAKEAAPINRRGWSPRPPQLRVTQLFRVNALHKVRYTLNRPIRVLALEFRREHVTGIGGLNTLPFQIERSISQINDERSFVCDEGAIADRTVVR